MVDNSLCLLRNDDLIGEGVKKSINRLSFFYKIKK